MLIASLPWYDLPEIRKATDAFWEGFARHLRQQGVLNVPARLNRNMGYIEQWLSPSLLFSQACGYDVLLGFPEHLRVVATPCYAAPGCEGSHYRSLVVVREDAPAQQLADLRGGRCVINTPTSHSGMNILRAMVAPLHMEGQFFQSVRLSGGHERSLDWIRRKEADVAAIDCITYALLKAHRPQALAGTRVLCQTEAVPAPPYVTSWGTTREDRRRVKAALTAALEDPALEDLRGTLLLAGAEFLTLDAYRSISELEQVAHDHNYSEIQVNAHRQMICATPPLKPSS